MRINTALVAGLAGLVSLAQAALIRGDATFTGSNVNGGTCSFVNYTLPAGVSGVGIGPPNWANGTKCGACLQVNGPRGSVKVMITDSCPSCAPNRLNLYEDAFRQIADPSDGIASVEFDIVSCGIGSQLWVRNKVGTSRWFFSMQVMNANYPVTALHVSTDGGNRWEATVRRDYNFFEREASGGFGQDRVLVRVSCSNGRQVILPDVSMSEYSESRAPANC
ncbi:RlpA-like double-psi beta-barrel-protein domain-containing protein-containing protein [Cercophora newfieldiana]|uniref:RlpA-like double-psi beta-barrel-protein domain-containing protein-containing protein n=1 Tax=Cercophora newfieldiana TaxID=92897 RepID=A0AA39YCD6_9PEZI|nr:RlpA-like double-psi beta-barrel-protein domain-containing protein-containing protein [Cercophora newfieldiana]